MPDQSPLTDAELAELRTAKPDEELDEVRDKAKRWIGGNGDLAALLRMYDWVRDELEYAHRMTEWAREQRDGMGEAFDSVVETFGEMKQQRDRASDTAKPVHYRQAATSIRAIAHKGMHPQRYMAFIDAANLLDSTARDLEDEGDTSE